MMMMHMQQEICDTESYPRIECRISKKKCSVIKYVYLIYIEIYESITILIINIYNIYRDVYALLAK